MATIILVHGFLGFGGTPSDFISYFRDVQQRYEAGGIHKVYCPNLGLLGVAKDRAQSLADFITNNIPATAGPLHFIAHSRGGIDCRVMLERHAQIAARTHRLIAIATPHFGTPVASHALGRPLIPASVNPLNAVAPDLLKSLEELTPEGVQHAAEVPPVSYIRIACDAADLNLLTSPFLSTQLIGNFGTLPNDGLVGLDSALAEKNAKSTRPGSWSVDHAGAIGWPTDKASITHPGKALAEHHARYDALLPLLLA